MFRNTSVRIVCAVAAMAYLASTGLTTAAETGKPASQTKEKKLTRQQIPAAVVEAFQKAYPKATIKGAGQETEDSTTLIEIESVDGSVKRDVQYTSDGKVVEIEERVTTGTLPDSARETIRKEYPKGKVEKAERVTRGGTTQFEVVVAVGKKRTELVFDNSGKTVKTESGKKDQD